MLWVLFIILMGVLARLAGRGVWGKIPEALHSIPYGVALGWAFDLAGAEFITALIVACVGVIISYAGMQSATWMFLRWETHDDPNTERSSTLKSVVDWIASKFSFKLGDEGYAWIAASVKGFIIGLPIGGIATAILWPLGYEIGSHADGRVQKIGIKDPHSVSEFMSGVAGGASIWIFCLIVGFLNGT